METLKKAVAAFVMLAPLMVWAQQTLTLSDAVEMALEKNPLRKATLAEARAAEAGVREARSGLWPQVMFSETATRGNDPVYVFGTKLRQQRFTTADFALNVLNTPTPIGNFTSRFSGQWKLFDSLQNYRSIERAKKMNDAAGAQVERSDQELIARVVQSYYGVLLAGQRVSLAEDALKSAQAIEEHSANRVESGMSVEADLLSARVQRASREQELIRAKNERAYAQVQLAITLGAGSGVTLVPAELLAEKALPEVQIAELERAALDRRADLRKVRSQEEAQQQSVNMAKSAFGPRVNSFGSWQTDSHSLGWNGGNNWTAGIELQMDLFAGGAKRAGLQREKAQAERLAAMRSAYEDNVRLEVRRAYYDFDAARQQVAVAKTATQQALESLRILQNRYEAGLTTVTDLLRAEEAAQRAQTDYWDAVYRVQTNYANLELASGGLSPTSPVVMK